MLPKVICIVGPTSSGKTALSIELAQRFSGEIINADARQVYQGFEIGTGSPTQQIKQRIPHYLFNNKNPLEVITAAEWKKQAEQSIQEVIARKKIPIITGGTGLYVDSLMQGYQSPPIADEKTRQIVRSMTPVEQVRLLKEKDPQSFQAIDIKNPRRVQRALEVVLATESSFIVQQKQQPSPYDVLWLAREWSRQDLYTRINQSVEDMIKQGWLEEVKRLSESGIPSDAPAMSSIGYRELLAVTKDEMVLNDALKLIQQKTRNYAKRQLTWFKRNQAIHWIKDVQEACKLVSEWIS